MTYEGKCLHGNIASMGTFAATLCQAQFYLSVFHSLIPSRKLGPLPWVRPQQPLQEQRYPFLPLCIVSHPSFPHLPRSKQWYGCQHLWWYTCYCMQGLYECIQRSALKVNSGRKILCCSWLEPMPVWCLAFQSNARPTELSHPFISTGS